MVVACAFGLVDLCIIVDIGQGVIAHDVDRSGELHRCALSCDSQSCTPGSQVVLIDRADGHTFEARDLTRRNDALVGIIAIVGLTGISQGRHLPFISIIDHTQRVGDQGLDEFPGLDTDAIDVIGQCVHNSTGSNISFGRFSDDGDGDRGRDTSAHTAADRPGDQIDLSLILRGHFDTTVRFGFHTA